MPHALPRFQPLALLLLCAAAPEEARWRAEAAGVTIARDTWGIAHVHGRSDADAVFGAIYAQAEDDFARVEDNYLTALGRRAEVEGEGALAGDLRQRLFVDEGDLRRRWTASAMWLRRLTVAWADGLNWFLATHPQVRPRLLTRFEPWMALSFTEGSIGGDVETIDEGRLAVFYGLTPPPIRTAALVTEPSGSNGIAIAPKLTRDGHALLLINPHTSFFFRAELQMTSDAGLDAYGAATWGQFFLYQGFNRHLGWMHTSSGVDAVDEFAETVARRGRGYVARVGSGWEPIVQRPITLRYSLPSGATATRTVVTYSTRHGPIVRAEGGRWIAVSLMNRPVPALEQSWLRTKATTLAAYLRVARLAANSSNNTVLADDRGDIAYLHPQFVPARDPALDWTQPVDGATAAWGPILPLARLPHAIDPPTGWIANTNDAPWGVAGPDSPRARDFPAFMDRYGENERGLHAQRLLTGASGWTPERLIGAAYDSWIPPFARLVPMLTATWDALPASDPRRARLAAPVARLRSWDDRWGAASVETTLAVYWGEALLKESGIPAKQGVATTDALAATTPEMKLAALDTAAARLQHDFGRWDVPWGEVNRFQRLDDAIHAIFRDDRPSMPVPFTSALWGSLASFGTRQEGTVRRYGVLGNSFVAVVEFGPRLRAWGVTAGGESGDPASPHFDDQAGRYATGALRPIWFYPEDVAAHTARRTHPGN